MSGEMYTPKPIPGGVVSPAGAHTDGHRANENRFTQIMIDGYTWVQKRLNGPGAMNYAFDSLALAESTSIGAGIAQRQYWASVARPLFTDQVFRPTSGYGGVIQGQVIYQPLFDPYNNTYGNIQP
jgi:hypothetical protein